MDQGVHELNEVMRGLKSVNEKGGWLNLQVRHKSGK
tara:strand:+ start:293 stop:400 length:108 start_codon:yes stop_codon:yes gene_type:complete